MMTRSGSNKTKINPARDLIQINLKNGKMKMFIPKSVDILDDYRPSYDTRLILAHCLCNALYGSVLKYLSRGKSVFANALETRGLAIIHWHRFLPYTIVPRGWYIHGENNPTVLCSSPQSAIYAFRGKEKAIKKSLTLNVEFMGDIHVEPEHGVNVVGSSLKRIAYFLFASL